MAPVRLHAKFLVLVLGMLVLFLGTFSIIIVRRESRILAQKGAEKEHLVAQTIFSDLKENMLAGRPRSTLTLIHSIEGTNGIVRATVLRPDGTPAFGAGGPTVVLPQLARAVATGRDMDLNDLSGPVPLHINLFPLKNDAVCRQCHAKYGDILGVVMLSHSIADTVHEVRSSTRNLLALLLTMMVVMAAALYFAVRKVVLDPLRTLHQGAEVIGKGDLSQRIHIDSGDEFQDLALSFNDMADRLKETYTGLENTVKVRTAELNESVRLMRGILSSMSSGVALLGRDGTVKLMNRQGAWTLGRGHEDLVGRKLDEIVPETKAFLEARVGSYEELTVQAPDGLATPIGFTTSNYSGEGEQEGMIVVFQDLTELKSLQTELVNKERFAAVGRVVAGVAHEIRNPLFAISAIGQIFERDLADAGQRELVHALLSETKRLNELVEELLIYGRPMKLKMQEADLWQLWQDVVELSRSELERRGITVRSDSPARYPVTQFDVHQVRQVLLNVLRNAMESMTDGGTLKTTMLMDDRFLLFRISDTGMGVPAGQLDHVFDLFFTTKPKGTGLGLPICRKIMQDHGGDIVLASDDGRGTTVTLRLPHRGEKESKESVK